MTPTATTADARQHVCLSYAGSAGFAAAAQRFLADGLDSGLRVRLVAGDNGAAQLERVGGLHAARPDAVQVQLLGDSYRSGAAVIDPTAQLQAYAAATEDAVASGFAGFRVAAEVTALVRTPEQLDAFARYEHLVERYMLGHPFTAMCGYDRVELGSSRVAQLACLHPQVHPASATPFRLHATPGATAALAGEIDMTDRELLIEALDRAEVWSAGTGEVVLDARELTFIDHQSLRLLAEEAERRGAAVVLRTRLRTAARLVELLGLHRLRVEPAP